MTEQLATAIPGLTVEPLGPEHAAELYEALKANEEHFRRYQNCPPITPEVARGMLEGGGHQWGIRLDGRVIGRVDLTLTRW